MEIFTCLSFYAGQCTESRAHLGQIGGQHAVRGWSGSHHNHGSARLTDSGKSALDLAN